MDYNRVTPRRRQDRGVQVVGANPNGGGGRARVQEATGGRAAAGANGAVDTTPRYRGRVEGIAQPAQAGQPKPGQAVSEAPAQQPGRGRLYRIQESPNVNTADPDQTGGVRPVPQTAAEAQQQTGGYKPQRARLDEQAGQPAPQSAGQAQEQYQPQPRRQRYVDYGSQQSPEAQPRRERSYEPQPSRSYEQPSRSSYEGGNSGSNGGGSNGGGRGRVR